MPRGEIGLRDGRCVSPCGDALHVMDTGRPSEARQRMLAEAFRACPKDEDGSVRYETLQDMVSLMDEALTWKTERSST